MAVLVRVITMAVLVDGRVSEGDHDGGVSEGDHDGGGVSEGDHDGRVTVITMVVWLVWWWC